MVGSQDKRTVRANNTATNLYETRGGSARARYEGRLRVRLTRNSSHNA